LIRADCSTRNSVRRIVQAQLGMVCALGGCGGQTLPYTAVVGEDSGSRETAAGDSGGEGGARTKLEDGGTYSKADDAQTAPNGQPDAPAPNIVSGAPPGDAGSQTSTRLSCVFYPSANCQSCLANAISVTCAQLWNELHGSCATSVRCAEQYCFCNAPNDPACDPRFCECAFGCTAPSDSACNARWESVLTCLDSSCNAKCK
jgi:hypothetical protein